MSSLVWDHMMMYSIFIDTLEYVCKKVKRLQEMYFYSKVFGFVNVVRKSFSK